MEVVGKLAGRQVVGPRQTVFSRVAGAVHAAMHLLRLLPNVLHDVDLAAARAADGANIVSEQPKGRPYSLSPRNLDAGLEASILLLKQSQSLETCGSVLTRDAFGPLVGLLAGGDDQIAILHLDVLGSVRIGLEFIVAPAAAGFHDPLVRIGRGTLRSAEFVGPNASIGRLLCPSLGRTAAEHRAG